MQIKSQREFKTGVEYSREFTWVDRPGSGFSFPCDRDGNLVPTDNPDAERNRRNCLDGTYAVVDRGVSERAWSYRVPAVGICEECGEDVTLVGFTNTCECSADYNMSGQRLAPREFWGEETGESVADILAADSDYENYRDDFDNY